MLSHSFSLLCAIGFVVGLSHLFLTCSLLARYLLVTCLFPRLAYCLLIPTGTTHLLVTCTYLSPAGISHLYFLIILSTISIVYQVIHPFLVAGTNFIRITTYQDILSGNPPTTTSTYLFSYILSCSTPLTTPYLSFFLILISISSLSTTYSSFFLILISILKKPTLFVTLCYSLLLFVTLCYFSLLLTTSRYFSRPTKKTSLSRLVLLVIYFFNLTIQYSSVTSTSLYIPFIS